MKLQCELTLSIEIDLLKLLMFGLEAVHTAAAIIIIMQWLA